jgi:hypothetical protein
MRTQPILNAVLYRGQGGKVEATPNAFHCRIDCAFVGNTSPNKLNACR